MPTSKPPDEAIQTSQTVTNGGTPPADPPPATAKPPVSQVATPAPAGAPADKPPRDVGADGELIPKELITLTTEALNSRTSRASRAFLKEHFGTDDPQVIKQQLAELDTHKKEKDDARRAEMTEIARVQEDNQRLLDRATSAEARVHELEEAQALAGDEKDLQAIAGRHVDLEYWEVIAPRLADHLASHYTDAEMDALTDKDREKVVSDFFADYAKKKPAMARKDETSQTQQPPGQQVVTRPLTNGGPNPRGKGDPKPPAVIQSGKFAGKTAAPGHANSMTAQEFLEWKRSRGITGF